MPATVTLVDSLGDVLWVSVVGDAGIQRGLVERPTVLAARCLDEGRQIGLGHV